MIVRFNLNKVLNLIHQEKLPAKFIDPNGLKHLDKWTAFAVEMLRFKSASPYTRLDFSYVDRTGAVPSVLNTHIPQEQLIPQGPPQSWDYLDICLARAQQILDTNQHINVMWSGGNDSTLVLFSFLRQARHLDQLSIVCTFESILESGSIFDKYILPLGLRIKFEQTRQECKLAYSYDHEDPNQLYVNGQCGDQLFGATNAYKLPGLELTDPWYHGYSKGFLDILEPSIKLSERPIETVKDLRWWLAFNHWWTTSLYDDYIERPLHLCRRIVPFYATPEFQRWAIHTPTYYEKTDQWRWPSKEALSKLVDATYFIKNKKKTMSPTWFKTLSWCMVDRDFKTYYLDEFLESLAK